MKELSHQSINQMAEEEGGGGRENESNHNSLETERSSSLCSFEDGWMDGWMDGQIDDDDCG